MHTLPKPWMTASSSNRCPRSRNRPSWSLGLSTSGGSTGVASAVFCAHHDQVNCQFLLRSHFSCCGNVRYLAECMHKGRPTCLAKILGVYEVGIKVKTLAGTAGNGKGKTCETHMRVMDVLVMENIFYGHSISRIYDLKGSLRHRYNADFANPRAVSAVQGMGSIDLSARILAHRPR